MDFEDLAGEHGERNCPAIYVQARTARIFSCAMRTVPVLDLQGIFPKAGFWAKASAAIPLDADPLPQYCGPLIH